MDVVAKLWVFGRLGFWDGMRGRGMAGTPRNTGCQCGVKGRVGDCQSLFEDLGLKAWFCRARMGKPGRVELRRVMNFPR